MYKITKIVEINTQILAKIILNDPSIEFLNFKMLKKNKYSKVYKFLQLIFFLIHQLYKYN